MPFPLLLLVPPITAALSGVSVSGLLASIPLAIAAINSAEAVSDWYQSGQGWAVLSDQLNKRLAAAGLDIEFPPFDPTTDEGRAVVKSTIERYVLDRINAKAGTEFKTVEGLNQDTFLTEAGRVLAGRVNNETGSNFAAVWPIEKLQDELHTEVMRQFDNRGRYQPGALFTAGTLEGIKEKVAAKHPELMAQVNAPIDGGQWGPPATEKIAARRAAGRIRQAKYRRTHQQVWTAK